MFQGVAVDVEMAKKKTLGGRHKENPEEHQSLSNVLILLIVIAMAAGVCLYMYNVAVRVYRLEQRVEMISHRCGSSARQVTATPQSVADRHRQTSDASTTSTTPSTTSLPSTSSPITDHQDWVDRLGKNSNYIDDGLKTHGDPEVGSGLLPDDEEDDDNEEDELSGDDDEELGGDDNSHELHDTTQSYKLLDDWLRLSSYDKIHKSRRKRSVSESDDRRRQHHHHQQQQQHHARRRSGHRTTSSHDSTGSNPTDTSRQHERRRDRRRSDRRRPRSHDDTIGGQLAQRNILLHIFTKCFTIFTIFGSDRSQLAPVQQHLKQFTIPEQCV